MIEPTTLLWGMRSRLPFRVAQRLLAQNNFPKGRSWDEVFEKFEDSDAQRRADVKGLERAYVEALIVCDKLCVIYEVDEAELRGVHQHADSLAAEIFSNSFAERFPIALQERELSKIPQNEATLVSVLTLPDATALIYSTSRLVEIREEVDPRYLNQNISNPYASIVGLKRKYIQAFDAVILPYLGNRFYVLTDLVRDVPYVSAVLDQITMRETFNSSCGKVILGSALNLFPAIRPLYEADEGEVNTLSHTVANGIKHEKMRGNRCVRRERFHQGGAAAVRGNLTPYQIAISWDLDELDGLAGRPELRLEGDYQMTYQVGAVLTEASVRKCATFPELSFVLQRLFAHLPPE